MMKIDVEGFEKEVIKGGEKLFNERENSILIIELLVEINGITICKKIKDILTRFNFKEVYKLILQKDLNSLTIVGLMEIIFF